MDHQEMYFRLKEFLQTGKFTQLRNQLSFLETLSVTQVSQEKLFLIHSQAVEQHLLQLKKLTDELLGLSSMSVTMKESASDLLVCPRCQEKMLRTEGEDTRVGYCTFCNDFFPIKGEV